MANHAIQKVCQEGVGYATVDLGGVRHLLAAAVPRRGQSVGQQADDALCTLAAAVGDEGFEGGIVRQAVFVADVAQIELCRQIIRDFYGSQLPATSYIPQPPCDGKLLGIEALAVTGGQSEVEIEHHSEQLVVARHTASPGPTRCRSFRSRPPGASTTPRPASLGKLIRCWAASASASTE